MRKYSDCQIKGCDREHKAHGWCKLHYDRWKRNGHPLILTHPVAKGPFKERFYSRIALPNEDGCMLWTGHKLKGGYALVRLLGKPKYVHRVAYELMVGPIPEGMEIDHVKARGCRSTSCCNPDHLEPVTPAENLRRSNCISAVNARKTHCVNGHPFDDRNTYIHKHGGRQCRACRREWARKNRRPKQDASK